MFTTWVQYLIGPEEGSGFPWSSSELWATKLVLETEPALDHWGISHPLPVAWYHMLYSELLLYFLKVAPVFPEEWQDTRELSRAWDSHIFTTFLHMIWWCNLWVLQSLLLLWLVLSLAFFFLKQWYVCAVFPPSFHRSVLTVPRSFWQSLLLYYSVWTLTFWIRERCVGRWCTDDISVSWYTWRGKSSVCYPGKGVSRHGRVLCSWTWTEKFPSTM